ncbi:MAG: hypothetical protein CVT49_06920 [candidate division Zixibacteria bacterium HGW-Zixibacteria-1]|nr:MAG: hypothetical protein CVT49_06920 [candidate division Zixibacteria bacterium HGW-Zixibacteria-1]
MEIALFYSKENSDHLKAANLVKRAVRNLGISAMITERDTLTPDPRIVINGFDLVNLIEQPGKGSGAKFSYDSVLKALESTAW